MGTWRYLRGIDALVAEKFAGRRWDFPSKIFADPTLLYPGVDIDAIDLYDRLARLRYRAAPGPVTHPGEYYVDESRKQIDLFVREFAAANGVQPARHLRLHLSGTVVRRIVDSSSDQDVVSAEIDPELLAGLYQDVWESRRLVALNQLPATLINAVLAVEDQRFFEHRGVDIVGIARALWVNLTSGGVVQGGSTLTQQLMKNFFLTEERTLARKAREAAMAVVAERRYSKREILENYLNEIYLGQSGAQGIFGVWEAARFYFGKEPAALDLAECALLAGLIKAPNHYSPFAHPDRALQRRKHALQLMRKAGRASDEEVAEASQAPLPSRPPPSRVVAPYFVDFLRQELSTTYPADVLTREGLAILTGLDPEMQRAAEDAIRSGLADLEKRHRKLARGSQRLQAALIAVQPQTGEIKAMMGGRDYGSTQFNRVVQAFRQPGSIFKPFTYIAALERAAAQGGVRPTTRLEDEPFTWEYEGQSWSPANYRKEYYGSVSVRTALQLSLNAATSRLAQQVGLDRIRETAQRMGITSPLPLYPSMVLGAVEVSPFEVAQAYAVLANQGLRARPLAVRAVIDLGGTPIERNPVEMEHAIGPQVAYIVTHLLEGVLDYGTGRGARGRGFHRPAAGKTGTTNDYHDAWFAGFTPDLLAVVWVGFDEKLPVGLSGSEAALPIWTEFMKRATASQPPRSFAPPPGVRMSVIDPLTGDLATPACPETLEESFLEGDEPTATCFLHAAAAPDSTRQGAPADAGGIAVR